ncbi:MAG: RloB family protein [Spirochaetia bacterium]|jgi:hypothetical protein|nr:RloB family protein [Spirochaetia bacterium]
METTRKYYFTVEGETEKRYLTWLQKTINATNEASANVSFSIGVKTKPTSFVKKLSLAGGKPTSIAHIADIGGPSSTDIQKIDKLLIDLKKSQKTKKVSYIFGYSNYCFELWIILHKMNCNNHMPNKNSYLALINKGYGMQFRSLSDYKEEKKIPKDTCHTYIG